MDQDTQPRRFRLALLGTPQLGAVSWPGDVPLTDDLLTQIDSKSPQFNPIKINRRKSFALLAYLATNRRVSQRQALMTLLWPDTEPTLAYSYLRREIAVLRRALGSDWLLVDRDSVGLSEQEKFWLDVHQFRHNLDLCAHHGHPVASVCPRCMKPLTRVVELYKGDFMSGFSFKDSPNFDDWRFFESEQIRNDLVGALSRLVEGYSAQQNFQAALQGARFWLELTPWHEPVHQELMRLYAWSGNKAAALRQYDTCITVLESELSQTPDADTNALYEAIRSNMLPSPAVGLFEPNLGTIDVVDVQQSAPGSRHDDTGSEPEVTTDEALSHPARMRQRHNLPVHTTPFVGRNQELTTIDRLLRTEPTCRLLTLVGPSGIGKTRLAVEAAFRAVDAFTDGAYVVALNNISSIPMLIQTIATSIGLELQRKTDPKIQLFDYLREKSILLMLDNFESVLTHGTPSEEGAQPGGDTFLIELIEQAPGAKVLVTTLERLNLQTEWVLPVEGLAYPAIDGATERLRVDNMTDLPETWQDYGAVRLFLLYLERTYPEGKIDHSDQVAVIKICQMVEGSPLALELAAAWTRVMSLADIAAEIFHSLMFLPVKARDIPERHRSIAALFENSWQLLSEDERDAVGKLAYFRGGFSWAAAAQVAEVDLGTLASLIDKSMVHSDRAGRYHIHEILRQCAIERMEQSPEQQRAVLARHCSYYAAFLRSRSDQLKEITRRSAADAILLEIDNVRAAWQWAVEHAKLAEIGQSILPLSRLYAIQGWVFEGEHMFRIAAETLSTGHPPAEGQTELGFLQGRLAIRQGYFAYRLGQYQQAKQLLADGIELLGRNREVDSPRQALDVALGLRYLGAIARRSSDYQLAEKHCRASLEIFEAARYLDGIAWTLQHLAIIAAEQSDLEQARDLFQAARDTYRQLNDPYGLADVLNNLGNVAEQLGETKVARQRHRECLATRRRLNDRRGISTSLNNLGYVEYKLGEYGEAKQHLLECLELQKEFGERDLLVNCLSNLGATMVALGAYDEAGRYYHQAFHIAGEADNRSLTLEVVASIAGVLESEQYSVQEASLAVALYAFITQQTDDKHHLHVGALEKLVVLEEGFAAADYSAIITRGTRADLTDVISWIQSLGNEAA